MLAVAMNAVPGAGSSWSFWRGASPLRPGGSSQRWRAVAALGVGAVSLGLAMSRPELAVHRRAVGESLWGVIGNASPFSSISMAASEVQEVVEPSTGMTFPSALEGGRLLTGTGLRKKRILGLKNITVYAYGVFVDPESLKSQLGDKYTSTEPEKLQKNEDFFEDLMVEDVGLTVRLVIVYGNLKIGSVRSAFEESVGSRIKKFGGSADVGLLASFTGAFTDDIKLPRGTTIDLIRLPGNILQTKIDDTQVGSVQSALLCRSLFDLYIGDEPFDKDAKKKIGQSLASLFCDHE